MYSNSTQWIFYCRGDPYIIIKSKNLSHFHSKPLTLKMSKTYYWGVQPRGPLCLSKIKAFSLKIPPHVQHDYFSKTVFFSELGAEVVNWVISLATIRYSVSHAIGNSVGNLMVFMGGFFIAQESLGRSLDFLGAVVAAVGFLEQIFSWFRILLPRILRKS